DEALLPANQKEIDAAIARGVAFLQAGLNEKGYFPSNGQGNLLGGTALIGLTLLSCAVPPDDPKIAAIAGRVRRDGPALGQTYELACCIWFLDKLGRYEDRELIQKMALRLIAGQGSHGGWNYGCSLLSSEQEADLMRLLQENPLLLTPVVGTTPTTAATNQPPKVQPKGGKQPKAGGLSGRGTFLPSDLRDLPVLKFKPDQSLSGVQQLWREDNSLTQFAILALWAAQKHGVPAQRSLALA